MRVSPIVLARWQFWLFLLASLWFGCGTVRNPALEQARDLYHKAAQDPVIVRHAATALDRAGHTLEEADRLWKDENDVVEVEHLAYIVTKRVEIARAVAQRRLAADEIRQTRSPRP